MNEQERFIQQTIYEATGIEPTEEQAHQFLQYYELLVEKNRVVNLTRITDFEDVVKKHFADSLAAARYVPIAGNERVLDLGTGAGFPGIPLKILFSNLKITLADSVGKKVNFVDEAASAIGLTGVVCVHGRAEDLARDHIYREQYDIVFSRAVANLSTLAEYCLPFVKIGGLFAAYKSGDCEEEVNDAKRAVSAVGGGHLRMMPYTLFDLNRTMILVEKMRKTPDLYPRKAGTPSKHPL